MPDYPMPDYIFQQWDEDRFLSKQKEWNDLLARSNADRLFLSWEWQASWWQVFADTSMQLRITAVSDYEGKLLALAPLYLSTEKTRGIKTRRLQFIGNCWRTRETMPTELLDFIIDKEQEPALLEALLKTIQKQPWDELVIPYLDKSSTSYKQLQQGQICPSCTVREAEQHRSYFLPIEGSFESYLESLSKSVRLKLYNRRQRLARSGEITFENHIDSGIDENFAQLNNLHAKRWSKPAFTGKRLAFNRMLAQRLRERKALSFSHLLHNGDILSMQYNYVLDGHVYNIQAGFNLPADKKIAPGYLHFGYEIEDAFKRGYHCYDLLAGAGKNSQYKAQLTPHAISAFDLQLVRKPMLKILYRLYALANPNIS